MASVNANAVPPVAQPIETVPANSSFIAAFEYDPNTMRLTTHMKDGAIYQHTFVLPLDWFALKTSAKHGKHWSASIKGKKLGIRVKSAKTANSELKHPRRK